MKKTIAMTCILKDELHNLPRFCESIAGLFDEYHFTDTGSKDGSVAWLMHDADKILGSDAKIFVHHFGWVNDFAAARNYALPMIKTDYWAWLDLDDVFSGREQFLAWRNEGINLADVWYLPYHYALNPDGTPAVSFIRERIFKTNQAFHFQDFIHEGVDVRKCKFPAPAVAIDAFCVKHMRTVDEMEADRGRNLRLLEEKKDSLSPRLQFYYGKELFDNKRMEEAAKVLREVVKSRDLEQGDRVMAFQYLIHSLNETKNYDDAIKYGVLGIQMEPNRAEYHCLVADSFAKKGEMHKAVPFFGAAKHCMNMSAGGLSHEFSFADGYSFLPRMNLAHIYAQQGNFEAALDELYPLQGEKVDEFRNFCQNAIKATTLKPDEELIPTEDIVITCPNPNAYDWDEEIYRKKGIGGSETAAVEISMHLSKLGHKVIIFQHRKDTWRSPSGVIYRPAPELHEYFQKFKPKLHIAWRHSARFTNAPSVVWSHDLRTAGAAQNKQNYDYILALSEPHKTFMMGVEGIPEDKIIVTRNGLEPARFGARDLIEKIPGKVIWPNSADRGLDWAIKVMDLVVKEIPEATLHVFYGMENMEKYGLKDQADKLRAMFCTRPWLKYRGNVEQTTLAAEFMESEVWLYPTNYFETHCITAIEAMSARAWPVVRSHGALKGTMKPAIENNMCDIIDCELDDELVPLFAEKVISAIKEKKWRNMDLKPDLFSWESVAKEWISMFKLKQDPR